MKKENKEAGQGPVSWEKKDKIVLVLLAAGDSRRFGGNKLLTLVGGRPMYRHLAEELLAIPRESFYRKLVVSQYEQILTDLGRNGFEPVENRDSGLGISHSIRLALERMDGREDGVCFAVCDQPWLRGQTILDMIAGWRQSGKGLACLSCGGVDGNPALFARSYEPELGMLTGDQGGKAVIRRHMEDLYRHETGNPEELEDIDTRENMPWN